MTAHPPVAVPFGHEAAQQTASGIGDAHGAVNKGLHLNPRFLNDSEIRKGYLSCRIDSDSAHVSPESGAGKIGDIAWVLIWMEP